MHIKRFSGKDANEAMRAVKEELGDEALILETRKAPDGDSVEVVAAVDRELRESRVERDDSAVLKELRELRELMGLMVTHNHTPAGRSFQRIEEELSKAGVDRAFVRDLLLSVLSRAGTDNGIPDVDSLLSDVKKTLLNSVKLKNPFADNGKRTVMTFVGPTGVGKTTTIAKLASILALKKKRRTALLTMDTYRIAAAEQLKLYGNIIGVPVDVAETPYELSGLVDKHRDKELILIDTAGRGRGDGAQIRQLKELAALIPSVKFNLVLSVNTRDECLYDTIKRFDSMPVDCLTLTKLDEAGGVGPILNTALYSKKPIAYLTTGQRVPEDIETATLDRLQRLFLAN